MKHVIIIPSLNPNERLISLIQELTSENKFKIIIVNDGSNAFYDDIFKKLYENKDVIILKHKKNLGKGAALKTAFSYCLENFKDYVGVVTCDDDGKYTLKDIIAIAEELNHHKNCLMLGVRNTNYTGNKILSYVFKFLYNLNIEDTKTGLRGIPMNEIKWLLKIHGNHYDFEINMLIQFKRRNIEIKQFPINIVNGIKDINHKTIKDTFRIFILIILNLSLYSAALFGSAIIDVGAFFISNTFIFSKMVIAERLFISTIISRTLSSLWNFSINRKFFTKAKGQFKNHFFRYYILLFCQMMVSYILIYLFSLRFNVNASIIKIIVDLLLAIFSYQVQLRFVFANSSSKEKPYGSLYYFCRWFLRVFNSKLKIVGEIPNEPVVFIGHHQNLKGVLNIVMWLEIPVHIWMLDVFCEKESCFNQFYGYTLTKRLGLNKPVAYILSKILSEFVPRLSNSMKAIPVSRNSMKVIEVTMKPSAAILNSGGNILLFPDIDYSSKEDSMGKMYTGFVNLDKFYFKQNKKHLVFVPIKVNKSKKTINIGEVSIVNDEMIFSQEKKRICKELVEKLNLL